MPQRLTAIEIWWPKGKMSERLFFGTLESRTKKAAEKIKINSAEVSMIEC